MTFRLVHARDSSATAVRFALEEAHAPYELTTLDLEAGGHRGSPSVSLAGRVPVLETDRGALTQVPAILDYVAALHPAAGLAPVEPFEAARMRSFNAFLSSTVHVAIMHYIRPERWADGGPALQALRDKAIPNFLHCFEQVEGGLAPGPWVLGERFSTADCYLHLFTRWLSRLDPDWTVFPRVRDHHMRMAERPAIRRVVEAEGAR